VEGCASRGCLSALQLIAVKSSAAHAWHTERTARDWLLFAPLDSVSFVDAWAAFLSKDAAHPQGGDQTGSDCALFCIVNALVGVGWVFEMVSHFKSGRMSANAKEDQPQRCPRALLGQGIRVSLCGPEVLAPS
jgi:hypothetical protein